MAWKFLRFAHRRVWPTAATTAAVTAAVAMTAATLAGVATPATADPMVTCTYTVSSSWNGGFTANVDITNNGPAISGWTLRWTFTTPTADVFAWSAVITEQDGNQATATNMAWNGTIATGQRASFGWSAAAVSTGVPSNLTINGQSC